MSKLLKPRLGRGLSSLLSVSELPVEAEIVPPQPVEPNASSAESGIQAPVFASLGGPLEIPVADVVANPHQPRRLMNENSIAELAASIKSTGLIQPIVVRRAGEKYELIAGERRLRAAKSAGLASIPAILREVDSFTQAQMALVENIQREDLNPIDRALAYQALIAQLGLTQGELAGRLGEDRSSIANHLRLLDLPAAVQTMVADGRLSLGHAKLLAGVTDAVEQERLANLVLSQNLSVRNLERLVQNAPTPRKQEAAAKLSAYLSDLEKNLSRQLGMRVQVRDTAKKGKGRVILHYANLDQFDELLHRLGVVAED